MCSIRARLHRGWHVLEGEVLELMHSSPATLTFASRRYPCAVTLEGWIELPCYRSPEAEDEFLDAPLHADKPVKLKVSPSLRPTCTADTQADQVQTLVAHASGVKATFCCA